MKVNAKLALPGATGKTGKYLLDELLKKGYHVKVLIRKLDNSTINHNTISLFKSL